MLRNGPTAQLHLLPLCSCLFLSLPFSFLPFQPLPGVPAPSQVPQAEVSSPAHPWAPPAQKHLAIGPWSRELIVFYYRTKPEQQFLWERLQTHLPMISLQPLQPSQGSCSCPISALQTLNPFQETKPSLAGPGDEAELCSCPCSLSRRCTETQVIHFIQEPFLLTQN